MHIDEVRDELKKRDHQDETRSIAPLKCAQDAFMIDSSGLNIQQVIKLMMKYMRDESREEAKE